MFTDGKVTACLTDETCTISKGDVSTKCNVSESRVKTVLTVGVSSYLVHEEDGSVNWHAVAERLAVKAFQSFVVDWQASGVRVAGVPSEATFIAPVLPLQQVSKSQELRSQCAKEMRTNLENDIAKDPSIALEMLPASEAKTSIVQGMFEAGEISEDRRDALLSE